MRVSTLGGGCRRLLTSMVLIALFTVALPGAVVAADEETASVEMFEGAGPSVGDLTQWRTASDTIVDCTMDNVHQISHRSSDSYSQGGNKWFWLGVMSRLVGSDEDFLHDVSYDESSDYNYTFYFCGTVDEGSWPSFGCTITGLGKLVESYDGMGGPIPGGRSIYIHHFEITEAYENDVTPRFSGSYTDSDGRAGTVTGALYPNLYRVCDRYTATVTVFALHPSP